MQGVKRFFPRPPWTMNWSKETGCIVNMFLCRAAIKLKRLRCLNNSVAVLYQRQAIKQPHTSTVMRFDFFHQLFSVVFFSKFLQSSERQNFRPLWMKMPCLNQCKQANGDKSPPFRFGIPQKGFGSSIVQGSFQRLDGSNIIELSNKRNAGLWNVPKATLRVTKGSRYSILRGYWQKGRSSCQIQF